MRKRLCQMIVFSASSANSRYHVAKSRSFSDADFIAISYLYEPERETPPAKSDCVSLPPPRPAKTVNALSGSSTSVEPTIAIFAGAIQTPHDRNQKTTSHGHSKNEGGIVFKTGWHLFPPKEAPLRTGFYWKRSEE